MPPVATSRTDSSQGYTNYGYGLSFLLHLAVIGIVWTGLPFLHRDPPEEAPLIIDVVDIADITAAAPKPQPEIAPEPTPDKPEPPKPLPPADAPPPAEAMPPPPKPEPPKPEPAKAPEPQIKPPPPKPTPPKATKQDDVAMLQKLLKDMQKSQPKAAAPATESKAKASNNIAANISDRATMTELDAIRHHIEACWRIDPGKEGIENLSVEIKVFINPDGSVQQAQFVDMGRYMADATFRTFANTARNAVLGCGNIPISPEHYSELKEIVMNFSPQGRIN